MSESAANRAAPASLPKTSSNPHSFTHLTPLASLHSTPHLTPLHLSYPTTCFGQLANTLSQNAKQVESLIASGMVLLCQYGSLKIFV